jgi:hypothetical protein
MLMQQHLLAEYSKNYCKSLRDVVVTALARDVFKITESYDVATALAGDVLKNYRCCIVGLAAYSQITESDNVATALAGRVFKITGVMLLQHS